MESQNDSLLLAIFVAILAILFEMLNPLNEKSLERQAQEVISNRFLTNMSATVLKDFATGAVSVSGFAPTVLTVMTTIFAVVHDLDLPPFWWMFATVAIVMIVCLIALRILSYKDIYSIATEKIRKPFSINFFNITYARLFSVIIIYFGNLVLIIICAYLYSFKPPTHSPF